MPSATSERTLQAPTPRSLIWFLAVFVLLLAPICFIGYGSDVDIYGMLESGRSTWHQHLPSTSRNPGYWTYELIMFCLASAGSFIATNFASLVVSVLVLWRFFVIARRLGVRFPFLVLACLAFTPVYAIASCSTMDYLWSLLGLVLCAECLIGGRIALAVLPAAFAFALRGANSVAIAGLIAGACIVAWRERQPPVRILQLLAAGAAAALLGSPPYIASYIHAGHSMTFAQAMAGPPSMWTFKLRIGRFGYKSLYLFGPLGWLLLTSTLALKRDVPDTVAPLQADYRRRAWPIFAGAVLLNLALFFEWSIEISYLIPAAFFGLLLLGITLLARRRWATVAVTVAIVSANFLTLQIVVPNVPGRSTGANFVPALKRGEMLEDIDERSAVRSCADKLCWGKNNIEPPLPPYPPPVVPPSAP